MAAQSGTVGAIYVSKMTAFTKATTSDYAEVTDPSGGELDFAAADSFAVETWVRVALQSDATGVVSKGLTAASDAGYAIAVTATSTATFGIDDGELSPSIASAANAITSDTWHHVVGVRDVDADKIRIYVDGAKTEGADTTSDTLVNASSLIIGGITADALDLALLRIYDAAPTDAQVSDLWQGQLPSDLHDNIVGEWLMYEGSGATLNDSSGNDNSATVNSDSANSWITTTYDTATAEAVGTGTGSAVDFTLDFGNVSDEGLTVTVGGTGQVLGDDYSLSTSGKIQFTSAPASDAAVVATYRHYPVTFSVGGFHNWSLDFTCDTLETTEFNTGVNRTFMAGMKSWTGSAERHWVDSLTQALITKKCILRFYSNEAGGKYWNGWGLVTGLHPSAAVDGLVEESLDFQGTHMMSIE